MSRIKPAEVRYYIDADLLGLARVLANLRPDVTFPGDPGAVIHKRQRPPCPVADPSVKDTEWIPEVARRGWVIITRDRHIQEHRLEIAAVRDNDAKMVALVGHDARSVFDQLEVVMCRWRDIERCWSQPPPFIYAAPAPHSERSPWTSKEALPQQTIGHKVQCISGPGDSPNQTL